MTKKILLDKPRRSPFVEGAARMNAIARPGEQNGDVPFVAAADRLAAISPDEAWSRRFASMAIGPAAGAPGQPPIPKPELAPAKDLAPTRSFANSGAKSAAAKPQKPGPIGLAIGKPVRRSLMARLFTKSS